MKSKRLEESSRYSFSPADLIFVIFSVRILLGRSISKSSVKIVFARNRFIVEMALVPFIFLLAIKWTILVTKIKYLVNLFLKFLIEFQTSFVNSRNSGFLDRFFYFESSICFWKVFFLSFILLFANVSEYLE